MKKQAVNKQKMTQTELARRLGMSQMTVSRVLNNQPGVKPEVQKKIRQGMKKYDYIPDMIASGLRSSTANVIGLIIPDVTDSFFPQITRSIEAGAKKYGFNIILSHSNSLYDLECEEINLLRGFRVKGLVIAPSGGQDDIDIYQKLQADQIPFVFIDRIKKKISSSFVVTDIKKATQQIGRYLIDKGYRKWGYLKGPGHVYSSDQHEKGLRASLKEKGGKGCSIKSVRAGFTEEDGYKAVKKLFRKDKPEVIVAVNDPVAIGAYRYLKENKIRVPKDVGLVGFSDLKMMDMLEVPLTTVRESTEDIGKEAIELLMREIADPSCDKQGVTLPAKLIIRESA